MSRIMSKGKRFISLLLTFAILMTMTPDLSLSVFADELEREYFSTTDGSAVPDDYEPVASAERRRSKAKSAETENEPLEKTQVLLIEDTLPWSNNTNSNLLNLLGISFKKVKTSEFLSQDLGNFSVIVFANDQQFSAYNNYATFREQIEMFAELGGVVLFGACDGGWANGNITSELPGGVTKYRAYEGRNYIVDENHPIVTGELSDDTPLTDSILYGNYCSHVSFNEDTLPENANVILRDTSRKAPTLVEFPYGRGHIILSGQTWEHNYVHANAFSKRSMDDLFLYAISIADIDVNSMPPIAVSVDAPKEIAITGSGYSPNPMIVKAFLKNVSDYKVDDVKVEIVLPTGLSLHKECEQSVEIGEMLPEQSSEVQWKVNIAAVNADKDYQYKIIVTAADGYQKVVTKTLHVPFLKQEKALEYTIFSGSNTADLNLYGWKSSFTGNVYTGRNFNYGGSEFYVDGRIDAVGTIITNGWKTEITERNEEAERVDMPDLDASIHEMAAPFEVHEESPAYVQDRTIIDSSIKVNGDVIISGTTFEGDCYIIAEGDITYNIQSFNTLGRVVLYSRNGNITINGSSIEINGIMYAPNGSVNFNTYETTLNGRIVADTINFNGSIFNINGRSDDWELIGGGNTPAKEDVAISADVPKYVPAAAVMNIPIVNINDVENLVYSAIFDGESMEIEDGVIKLIVPEIQGEYVLTISADAPNGGHDSVSYDVIVDTTAPLVTIDADRTFAYTNREDISVKVSAEDDYELRNVLIYINGEKTEYERNEEFFISTAEAGVYTIRAEAIDEAGNISITELAITIAEDISDKEPPIVSLTFDKDTYCAGDTAVITAWAEDNVEIDRVELFHDGVVYTFGEDNKLSIENLLEGENVFTVTAYDTSDNRATMKYTITVGSIPDTTPPEVAIESITPSEIYVDDTVTITVSAFDESGIAEITAAINGVSVPVVNGTITYVPTETGNYSVAVTATDAFGNVNTAAASFDVSERDASDTEAPQVKVTLSWYGENPVVNEPLTITVSAEDNSGSAEVTVLINGDKINGTDNVFTFVPPTAGSYTIEISAADPSGNATVCSCTIYVGEDAQIDGIPPEVSTIFENLVVQIGDTIKAAVKASDNSGEVYVSAEVNGVPLPITNGVIEYVPEAIGDYLFVITATDEAGNTTITKQNISVVAGTADTTPPALNISGLPSHIVLGELIEAQIDASDNRGSVSVSAFVNGTEIGVSNGVLEFEPQSAGEYLFVITAVDEAGNETEVTRRVIVTDRAIEDTTAPDLEIISFPAQANIGEEVKLEFRATDDSGEVFVTVTVNGKEIPFTDGTAVFTPDKAGSYDVVISVYDAAGNNRTAKGTVTAVAAFDSTLPTMSITGLTHFMTLGETLVIGITASDDSGVVNTTATINGKMTDIVDGKIEFTPDKTGIYKFIIRTEDPSGNFVQKEYDILVTESLSYDDGKPVVTIYANNGSDTANIGETIEFQVTANDPDGVESVSVTVNGKDVELDRDGKASFTPDEIGRYTITVKAIDALGNEIRESVKIKVIDPADRTVCDVAITSPADGAVVTSPVEVTGTVSGEGLVYYALEYCPAGGTEYAEFASGNTAVNNGVLGTFDPTLLENGYYNIRLTARSSNYIVSDEIVVSVEGQMKIGNYSIAFRDMDIPVAGYPLTVIRSYDSRRKSSNGDFGYGWNMTLSSIKLSESCDPGLYWTQEAAKSGFVTKYYFAEDRTHEISIDYGNGKTDKFKMKLSPDQQNLYPIRYDISVSYEPQGNTKSKLEAIGTTTGLIFNGSKLYYSDTLNTYNPSKYKLTRADGTVYIISDKNGVESITDTNGNVITFTENEVKHSDGKSIVFERDSENRVTKITDPYGKTVRYTYNSNGDLSAVTDKAGETTTFKYDRNHYLTDIIDSRGIKVARNEYDDNGRLIATIDANGNRLEFSHDIEGRQDVVTDRLGHSTVYIYDGRGNVISETDALGNTTLSTYDSYGNLKSKTDALGNVTTYNYDAQGNLISMTNALGETVNNTYSEKGQLKTITSMGVTQFVVNYDDFGNLTDTTDAEGNETKYKYDIKGRVISITDGIGSYMQMSYDSEGRVVSSVNGNGETVTFTYDSEGNCASKTVTRTTENGVENLTEKYAYDVYGNVTQIIYADGSVTNTEYDSVGNMTAAVDSKGRRTTYDYDLYGNLVKITYCDNTTETFEYDVENRNIKATDRLGRTVEMTYDAVGNLVEKTYPNGSKVSYVYDAKYRLVSTTEANGGTAKYEYDVLDRNTAIIDALGNRTEFGYSTTSGQLETMTDAKGNTYTYGYDLNGNRTSVTMPDGTTVTTAYDARGRVVSQTDQHGFTTKYTYDGADRLTSVTDALGSTWRYAYDSVGELISITDANGNTTRYEYDSCGRVIKTTNAKGSAATVTYDEIGNVLISTDYAGNTTSYVYDALDRVVSKTVGSDSVFYTYTDDGMLSSVSDKNGTITYTYDIMNGLKSVTTYDGSTIEYNYDNACRLTEVKTPFGTTQYEYDRMDRLVRVVAHDGTATLYEYDVNGNRTAVRYANGIVVSYEYDEVNRLVREKVLDKNGASVVEYSYTLGAAGERLKVVETGRTVEYEYDELYRLTKETVTDHSGTTVTEYTYDRNSNRLTKTVDGEVTEYIYNELNQLVSETGISYEYDLNGNLVKKTEDNQTTTYTYNAQNKLIRVTVQSGQQVEVEEYRYDYAGNRIAKIGELSATYYLVDTNGALSQVLAEYDENGSLTTYYTRGAELISQERDGEKHYYLYDGFDSVRMLTDEDGTATDFYTFDAFGNLTEQIGDTENSYLYRGEQYDSFTGLYYLRARYMNPATGTFITMDEYAGSVFEPVSLHKYLYANANPVMNSDPTGYFTLADCSVANAISSTLNKMYTSNMMGTLNGMLNALLVSLAGGTQEEIQAAFVNGFRDGFLMGGGNAALGQLAGCIPIPKLLVAAFKIFCAAGDLQAGIAAFEDGNYLLGSIYICSSAANFFSAYKTAGQACFTGDTLVAVEGGQKRIDEIEVGDKVWAYNVETGETELKTVTKVYVHSVDEILHLYTDEGDIDTTSNHPFYVIGKGWVAAGDLVAGDEVYNLDGTISTILGSEIEVFDEPLLVYNLEVEDFHSYFVGCVPVLVHNYPQSGSQQNGQSSGKRQTPDQKALYDLAKEAVNRYRNGNPISYSEAQILDEWASQYNVPQHHPADLNSGNHFNGVNHTHIYNWHVPFK